MLMILIKFLKQLWKKASDKIEWKLSSLINIHPILMFVNCIKNNDKYKFYIDDFVISFSLIL